MDEATKKKEHAENKKDLENPMDVINNIIKAAVEKALAEALKVVNNIKEIGEKAKEGQNISNEELNLLKL